MKTTIGQIIVNDALPEDLRDSNRELTGNSADDLLGAVARKYPEKYKTISHALMQHGREASFREGATLGLTDMITPIDRKELFNHLRIQTRKIMTSKEMSEADKQIALAGVYNQVQKFMIDNTLSATSANDNPFAMQVISKARGNPQQLAALMTTPGTYTDADDKLIPVFIRHSYAEGLKPHEYWASTYGARKSIISTKFCLAAGTQVLAGIDCKPTAIEDLRIDDIVWTLDDEDKLRPTSVNATTCVGQRICDVFEFGDGAGRAVRTVVATPEHKALLEHRNYLGITVRVMEPLAKATKGRRSAVLPAGMSDVGMVNASPSRALLLGTLLGDGGVTTKQTKLYLSDKLLIATLTNTLGEHNLKLHLDEAHATVNTYSVQEVIPSTGIGAGHKTSLRTWLDGLGVLGKYTYEKSIPDVVYTWDNKAVGALVAGLWATDGCTTHVCNKYGKRYPVVTFYCTSELLSSSFKRLLSLKLGVYSTPISCRRVCGDISQFPDGRTSTRNHNLYGFCISDLTSLQRLVKACPIVATKILALNDSLRIPRLRKPNLSARFRRHTSAGLHYVYDIEVLDPSHRFVLANGLVVSNSTQDAGYLGKQFNQAAMRVIVTGEDCETNNGLPVPVDDKDNIGSVLARKSGKYPAGTIVSKEVMNDIKNTGISKLMVRSPLTCSLGQGVCKHCVGHREDGKFPRMGANVGINASSALAERIAQSSLNVKHSGGMGKGDGKKVYSGFDVIENLFQVPETFPNEAAVASEDGRIKSITKAPQGGWNVVVNDLPHYVMPGVDLRVKEGDSVEAGDQLSDGIANPRAVVQYKGLGEGRRYFTERAVQAFRDTGYPVHRRNMELLVRGVLDSAKVEDPNGLGDYLPGDVASYSKLASSYKPRKDAQMAEPAQSVGKYLEQPIMHYTIGTRVTKRVAKDLSDFGHTSVMTHASPPAFEPYMVSLRAVPQYEEDWMAQLGSSYLKSNLLENVHRGAKSDVHGLHPVPGIAKGIGFDTPGPGKVGY